MKTYRFGSEHMIPYLGQKNHLLLFFDCLQTRLVISSNSTHTRGLFMNDSNLSFDFCPCRRCKDSHPQLNTPIMGMAFPYSVTHMVVCALCGNKRCPHAEDHRYMCTQSNEPGQTPRLMAQSIPVSRDEQDSEQNVPSDDHPSLF